MIVVLNTDDEQFGPDGPKKGAKGIVHEIRKIDGDYWAFTVFKGFPGFFYTVPLDMVMRPNTENTETYWSTLL